MAGNSAFVLVTGHGWQRGLRNMLRVELTRWWKTRTWWVNTLIWVAVIDIIMFMAMFSAEAQGESIPAEELLMIYSIFAGFAVGVGVTIMMQGAIIGERQNGVAAWVLSKPVSRTAYILSKFIANGLGVLVTAVGAPGLVAFAGLKLFAQAQFSLLNFLAGLAVIIVFALFWLAFTLMLGAFFESRGAVIGLPLGLILGSQFILGLAPWLAYVIPYTLVLPFGDEQGSSMATSVILGHSPDSYLPLISALVLIILMTAVGIWRFSKEEF